MQQGKLQRILLAFSISASILLFLSPVRRLAEKSTTIHSIYLLVLAFCISYTVMPALIAAGFRIGLVDHPNEARKIHHHATPVTGGIGIYIAFVITILFNFHFSLGMKAILFSSSLIFLMGILDDRWGLSAKIRLSVQVISALILVFYGVRITFIPDWLGGIYAETLLTVLWIVGITNSMNFIDGMDGLASGSCIIYGLFFALIALLTDQFYMMFLAVAIAGSCLGFFPYNFCPGKPAQVFLGDAGSTFLGFLLASFAILGEWGDNILDLAVPVLVMSVLIFDMCLTTIVRIHSGDVRNFSEWLHYTGRDHFHHRLTGLGLSKEAAALVFFSVSICFGIEALAILFSEYYVSLLIIVHSILAFIIVGSILVLRTGTNGHTPSHEVNKEDALCKSPQASII